MKPAYFHMIDLEKRLVLPEMMDDLTIPSDLLVENLKELDWLNRYTGGHRLSIVGLKEFNLDKDKKYHLVDIGCGSGDSMIYMAKWARRKKLNLHFTGVDINFNAIRYLTQHCKEFPEIKGINADWRDYFNGNDEIDFIHCSLFCHHLTTPELENFLIQASLKCKMGVILNDLTRSRMAYHIVSAFTSIMNATPLAKNDGPLSVRKAFTSAEMKNLLNGIGFRHFNIKPGFPFRYLITIKTIED